MIADVAAVCPELIYVDDLLALVFGPGHTVLVYLALLAATKMAGLVVEDHSCVAVFVPRGRRVAQHLLSPFPIVAHTEEGSGEGFWLRSGPVDLYVAVLRALGAIPAGIDITTFRTVCHCKAKHALVPAGPRSSLAEGGDHMPHVRDRRRGCQSFDDKPC